MVWAFLGGVGAVFVLATLGVVALRAADWAADRYGSGVGFVVFITLTVGPVIGAAAAVIMRMT